MFDFTKETIINSSKIEDGINRISSETGKMFRVLRCADYLKANVVNKVYKTKGRYGKLATATFTAPTIKGSYRVDINLKLTDKYLSDYATAVYNFQKPVMVEFELISVTASDNAKKMAKAINLAIPENYRFLKAEAMGDTVFVTCTEASQFIQLAELFKYTPNAIFPSEGTFDLVASAQITTNVTPFATGQWLIENLRFPTYENLRYNALNEDERPIAKALYTQYSFEYNVNRKGLTGMGTVGQTLQSLTTHKFYVLNELVELFETNLENAFGAGCIEELSPVTTYAITVLPAEVDNDGVAHSLASTITPTTGFVPKFTYSLVTPITGVVLTNSGEITVDTTVVVGTKIPVISKELNTLTEVIKDISVI